jgi:hypothetical protein
MSVGDVDYDCRIEDLSRGGVRVESDCDLRFGEHVVLCFALEGFAVAIDAEAIVRWNTRGQLGLQFESLREHDESALGQFLTRFEAPPSS